METNLKKEKYISSAVYLKHCISTILHLKNDAPGWSPKNAHTCYDMLYIYQRFGYS